MTIDCKTMKEKKLYIIFIVFDVNGVNSLRYHNVYLKTWVSRR